MASAGGERCSQVLGGAWTRFQAGQRLAEGGGPGEGRGAGPSSGDQSEEQTLGAEGGASGRGDEGSEGPSVSGVRGSGRVACRSCGAVRGLAHSDGMPTGSSKRGAGCSRAPGSARREEWIFHSRDGTRRAGGAGGGGARLGLAGGGPAGHARPGAAAAGTSGAEPGRGVGAWAGSRLRCHEPGSGVTPPSPRIGLWYPHSRAVSPGPRAWRPRGRRSGREFLRPSPCPTATVSSALSRRGHRGAPCGVPPTPGPVCPRCGPSRQRPPGRHVLVPTPLLGGSLPRCLPPGEPLLDPGPAPVLSGYSPPTQH